MRLQANGVDLSKAKCRVGPTLAINTGAERFVDNADANKMLTREYRKGFEVPAKV